MHEAIVNATVLIAKGERAKVCIPRVPLGQCIFVVAQEGLASENTLNVVAGGDVIKLLRTENGTFKLSDEQLYNTVSDFLTDRGLTIFPVSQEITGDSVLVSAHKCCSNLYKTNVTNGFIISTDKIERKVAFWTGGDYVIDGKIVTYFPDQAGVDRFVYLYEMR